jgi:hypothetical protein
MHKWQVLDEGADSSGGPARGPARTRADATSCEQDTISITIRIPSDVRFSVTEYERNGWFEGYRDVSPRRDMSVSLDRLWCK